MRVFQRKRNFEQNNCNPSLQTLYQLNSLKSHHGKLLQLGSFIKLKIKLLNMERLRWFSNCCRLFIRTASISDRLLLKCSVPIYNLNDKIIFQTFINKLVLLCLMTLCQHTLCCIRINKLQIYLAHISHYYSLDNICLPWTFEPLS